MMKKILINAPKGGVGKTTLATNIALMLAREGYRVWALDLAQGRQMSTYLSCTDEFDNKNKIEVKELESIPLNFPGASQFDFLVVDTDDYHKIISDLSDPKKSNGWKIIVPIVDEYNGLQRIPEELSALMLAIMLKSQPKLNLKAFGNKIQKNSPESSINNIKEALEKKGVENLLGTSYITLCESQPPYYIDNTQFSTELKEILEEMGAL